MHFQSVKQPSICIYDKIGKLTTKTQEHTDKKAADNKCTGSEGIKHERTPNRHNGNMASVFRIFIVGLINFDSPILSLMDYFLWISVIFRAAKKILKK